MAANHTWELNKLRAEHMNVEMLKSQQGQGGVTHSRLCPDPLKGGYGGYG